MKKILFVILSVLLISCDPVRIIAFRVSNKSSLPIAVVADFLPKGDSILKEAKYWGILRSNKSSEFNISENAYQRIKLGDTLSIYVVNKEDFDEKSCLIKDSCKILEKTYLDWNRLRNEYSFTYYGE